MPFAFVATDSQSYEDGYGDLLECADDVLDQLLIELDSIE